MGWFWVCIALAWAHPFGAQAVAHDLVVEIDPQGVSASWRIDVPTPIILQDMSRSRQSSFKRVLAEVSGTVQVLKGGQRVVGAVRPEEPYPSDATSWVFPVVVNAHSTSGDVVEWVFSNGTFTDLRGFYRFDLRIDDRIEVLDSSLLMRDSSGAFAWDASGRWREGEGYREVSVKVAPRRGLDRVWRKYVQRVSGQADLLEGARLAPSQIWLTHPHVPWLPGVCIWIWMALLSTGHVSEGTRSTRFRVFCMGSFMGLLCLAGDHTPTVTAIAAILGGGAWILGRGPNSRFGGLTLMVASVGVTLGTWVACGIALCWVGLGSYSRQSSPRWVQLGLAALGVAWLMFRWLAVR